MSLYKAFFTGALTGAAIVGPFAYRWLRRKTPASYELAHAVGYVFPPARLAPRDEMDALQADIHATSADKLLRRILGGSTV